MACVALHIGGYGEVVRYATALCISYGASCAAG